MIMVMTTIQTTRQAEDLVDLLLEKKLIACGGYFPIESRYNWKGKRHHNQEYRVEMETREELYDEVERVILEYHPYDEPVVLQWKVDGSTASCKWVDDVTT